MTNPKSILCAAAVALAIPAWTLSAQDNASPIPPKPPGEGGAPRPSEDQAQRHGWRRDGGDMRQWSPRALFDALDTNHDGVIDAEEMKNAPEVLKRLNRRGDGRLTIEDAFRGGDRNEARSADNRPPDARERQGRPGSEGGVNPQRGDAWPQGRHERWGQFSGNQPNHSAQQGAPGAGANGTQGAPRPDGARSPQNQGAAADHRGFQPFAARSWQGQPRSGGWASREHRSFGPGFGFDPHRAWAGNRSEGSSERSFRDHDHRWFGFSGEQRLSRHHGQSGQGFHGWRHQHHRGFAGGENYGGRSEHRWSHMHHHRHHHRHHHQWFGMGKGGRHGWAQSGHQEGPQMWGRHQDGFSWRQEDGGRPSNFDRFSQGNERRFSHRPWSRDGGNDFHGPQRGTPPAPRGSDRSQNGPPPAPRFQPGGTPHSTPPATPQSGRPPTSGAIDPGAPADRPISERDEQQTSVPPAADTENPQTLASIDRVI